MESAPAIVLGPQEINAIGHAIDALLPWLAESRFRVLEDGVLEFDRPEPVEAIGALRGAVEEVLPEQLCMYLGERSGLGWQVFFGHVVGWWLPQRQRIGFLRALIDRAALHGVDLHLHWNQGRTIPPSVQRPGRDVLYWGGGLGVAAAFAATRIWYLGATGALTIVGIGLVAGRIYQRTQSIRFCGEPLCRARLDGTPKCMSCGAQSGWDA